MASPWSGEGNHGPSVPPPKDPWELAHRANPGVAARPPDPGDGMMARRAHRSGLAAVFLAGLLGVLLGGLLVWIPMRSRVGSPGKVQSATGPPPAISKESQDAIIAAVAKVGPAVVNINTLIEPHISPRERMLRDALGMPTEAFPSPGQGSGIIINGQKGYVLTNAHMVEDVVSLQVTLADQREFSAKVVGVDPESDIAVVQIPAENLPEATLGSVSSVPIGSWVIAIGNPFGYENSVTVGVISAKDREIAHPSGMILRNLIQTDASVNPGNSGGALVDLNGNVIGIPTAIIPQAQGIGFAISADVAKKVATRLTAKGGAAWVGVAVRDVDIEEAAAAGLEELAGAVVVNVTPRSPAADASIRAGDIIIGWNEVTVEDDRALSDLVRASRPGDRVRITLLRTGTEVITEVNVGETP